MKRYEKKLFEYQEGPEYWTITLYFDGQKYTLTRTGNVETGDHRHYPIDLKVDFTIEYLKTHTQKDLQTDAGRAFGYFCYDLSKDETIMNLFEQHRQ